MAYQDDQAAEDSNLDYLSQSPSSDYTKDDSGQEIDAFFEKVGISGSDVAPVADESTHIIGFYINMLLQIMTSNISYAL